MSAVQTLGFLMEPIFLGTKEIANLLKINPQRIGYYVLEYALPAFKEHDGETAPWKARRESLEAWAAEFEQKMLAKIKEKTSRVLAGKLDRIYT